MFEPFEPVQNLTPQTGKRLISYHLAIPEGSYNPLQSGPVGSYNRNEVKIL